MTPIQRAIAEWRKRPAKVRKGIIEYFVDEANQSRDWAAEAPLFGKKADLIAEAEAIEAVVAIMRAASAKPKRVKR